MEHRITKVRMDHESGLNQGPMDRYLNVKKSFLFFDKADEHFMEVLRGSSVALFMRGGSAVLFLIFNLVLARLLGPEGAGIFFLALTIITIASVISRLGLDQALLRFISAHAVGGDWGKIGNIHRKSIYLVSGTGLLLTILIYFSAPSLALGLFSKPELTVPLRIMVLAIWPLGLLSLNSESLRALKKIRDAMLTHSQGLGIATASLGLLLALAGRYGINGAAAAYLMAACIMLLASQIIWRRSAKQSYNAQGTFNTGTLLSTGLSLLLIASMTMVMNWTDTVMLGIWQTSVQVGIYNIALRTALLTSFLLSAAATILAPKFSSLYTTGDLKSLEELVRKSTRVIASSAALVTLILVLAPRSVLGLFGPGFQTGATALIILAIGQFINASVGCLGHLLIMTGNHRSLHWITLLSAVLNIALNALLIPVYGINGAAMATAVSLSLFNLSCVVAVKRRLGINVFVSGKN